MREMITILDQTMKVRITCRETFPLLVKRTFVSIQPLHEDLRHIFFHKTYWNKVKEKFMGVTSCFHTTCKTSKCLPCKCWF